DIYKHIVPKIYQSKSKKDMGNFGKKYCTIPLRLLKSLVESYKHDEESIPEILEGLRHFIPALNDYFKLLPPMSETQMEKTGANLILYESFALTNNEQVRATKNYYNAPMFSDVAVFMDSEQEKFETYDGYCFAKVLLLVRIVLENTSIFDLALIRWYDFKYPNIPSKFYKYG
ncbi:10720_t:CDS:2, partial [Racocetra persica]